MRVPLHSCSLACIILHNIFHHLFRQQHLTRRCCPLQIDTRCPIVFVIDNCHCVHAPVYFQWCSNSRVCCNHSCDRRVNIVIQVVINICILILCRSRPTTGDPFSILCHFSISGTSLHIPCSLRCHSTSKNQELLFRWQVLFLKSRRGASPSPYAQLRTQTVTSNHKLFRC